MQTVNLLTLCNLWCILYSLRATWWEFPLCEHIQSFEIQLTNIDLSFIIENIWNYHNNMFAMYILLRKEGTHFAKLNFRGLSGRAWKASLECIWRKENGILLWDNNAQWFHQNIHHTTCLPPCQKFTHSVM